MAHNYNSGYAVVDSDPNGIPTLQSGHIIKLAISENGSQIWRFVEGNSDGTKWVELDTDELHDHDDRYVTIDTTQTITGVKTFNESVVVNDELQAESFIKEDGTSSQFLKADGTVDSNTYLTITSGGVQQNLQSVIDIGNFAETTSNSISTMSLHNRGDGRSLDLISNGTDKTALAVNGGVVISGTIIVNGSITSSDSFIKMGGTSSQFLKADGTVDSNSYALTTHDRYEFAFTKNTAFNKIFGTASRTVAQGSDSRILNGQTAFTKKVNSIGITCDTNKILTLTREDGTTLTETFRDIGTSDVDVFLNSLNFNTGNGNFTAVLNDNATSSVNLDGRYSILNHNHDNRYYTKTQSNVRFLGITAKAVDSNLLDGLNSTDFLREYRTRTAVDANTFTGTSSIRRVGITTAALNLPIASGFGSIIQLNNSDVNTQVYVGRDNGGSLFVRGATGSTLVGSAWNRVWASGNSNLPTVDWEARELRASGLDIDGTTNELTEIISYSRTDNTQNAYIKYDGAGQWVFGARDSDRFTLGTNAVFRGSVSGQGFTSSAVLGDANDVNSSLGANTMTLNNNTTGSVNFPTVFGQSLIETVAKST